MKVTLIEAVSKKIVHGTVNDKKTACGLNLLKSDDYQDRGEMVNLGELTCEKCKKRIAKQLIKDDIRKMKELLRQDNEQGQTGHTD